MRRCYWPPTTIPKGSLGSMGALPVGGGQKTLRTRKGLAPGLQSAAGGQGAQMRSWFIVANPLCRYGSSSHSAGAQRTLSPRRIGAATAEHRPSAVRGLLNQIPLSYIHLPFSFLSFLLLTIFHVQHTHDAPNPMHPSCPLLNRALAAYGTRRNVSWPTCTAASYTLEAYAGLTTPCILQRLPFLPRVYPVSETRRLVETSTSWHHCT